MRVVFRADASLEIGTGHVMRCLTLAGALARYGADATFVCREHDAHMCDFLVSRGFPVARLPPSSAGFNAATSPKYAAWVGASWREDAEQTGIAVTELKSRPRWVVVDHYGLGADWERELRRLADHVLVIDDLADRQHDCDILLDQNYGSDSSKYAKSVSTGCRVLTGSTYALVRPEFAALRNDSLLRRKGPFVRNVLVAMGGVDAHNMTAHVLRGLESASLPRDCEISIILGRSNRWADAVRAYATQMPWKTDVRVDVTDMARWMANCDLAIGGAGSTNWERCCLGVPSIILVLAANQAETAASLVEAGAAVTLDVADVHSRLGGMVSRLACDHVLRQRMANAASAIVDGNGVERVIREMYELGGFK